MIGWIVLAVVALLVLVTYCLRVGVMAGYDGENGWATAYVGPKKIALYPRPAPKKKKPKKRKEGAKPARPKPGPKELLALARALLPAFREAAGKLRRTLRVDELTLHLIWGEPDPADAAIHYGWAWGTVEAGLAFLQANVNIKRRQVRLDLDYQLERPRLTGGGKVSLTVAQLLAIVLPLGWAVLTTLLRQRKQQRAQAASAGQERKGEENHGKESSCQ